MTTNTTGNLCQGCGNPYPPGAVFCGYCGNQVTTVAEKTTIPFQYSTSDTNNVSTELRNPGMHMSYGPPTPAFYPPPPQLAYRAPGNTPPPVAPKKPFWSARKIVLLSTIIALLLLVIGVSLFPMAYQLGKNRLFPGPSAQPTARTASGTNSTPVSGIDPTPTSTAVPTDTPTAVTTPTLTTVSNARTILENRKFLCANCAYPELDVVLDNITLDTDNNKTVLKFTITNGGVDQCSNLYFDTFQFQDSLGNNYDRQTNNSFSVSPKQSIDDNEVLSGVLQSGTQYTLNITIQVNSCLNFLYKENPYQTENFTF